MIFEMCAGYELRTVEPTAEQMTDLDRYPQVCLECANSNRVSSWDMKINFGSIDCLQVAEFLQTIFDRTKPRRLSVHELLVHDFFRNIDLREMRSAPVTVSFDQILISNFHKPSLCFSRFNFLYNLPFFHETFM